MKQQQQQNQNKITEVAQCKTDIETVWTS